MQDLLHHIGEKGLTNSTYGERDDDVLRARREPTIRQLSGNVQILDTREKSGLPECLSATAAVYMFRAIRIATRGRTPYLTWAHPVKCGTQLKLTLQDDRRFQQVTLRAKPFLQHRPAQDNVKVWVDEDEGRKLYFGRYV